MSHTNRFRHETMAEKGFFDTDHRRKPVHDFSSTALEADQTSILSTQTTKERGTSFVVAGMNIVTSRIEEKKIFGNS